ncbi:hypothetical protein CEXT_15871 [Caerostris extrusa]|uniref:Uncharacterized protein n=1 Tax=Caerostris extrusa TaxID=172846 RepID=A0AAV4NY95_CAEEX|nr:hypothetical protein CEXT_15871 [Caerostris extrusa]
MLFQSIYTCCYFWNARNFDLSHLPQDVFQKESEVDSFYNLESRENNLDILLEIRGGVIEHLLHFTRGFDREIYFPKGDVTDDILRERLTQKKIVSERDLK